MKYTQGSIISTVQAVQGFLTANAGQLGGVATGVASKKLDDIAASLDAHGREQEARAIAARAATVKRNSARHTLIVDHMRPIASLAAAELENYAELTALHMPRLNVIDQALIQKARAMASTASDHEPTFSQGLVNATYAADLERAAENLVAALKERGEAVGRRQQATAGLAADTRTARKRLRVVDKLVMTAIRKDPALVARWSAAKQISKKAGSPRGVVGPDDAAPAVPIATPTPVSVATPSVSKEAA
jgi:hypothetical protein